jgi:hypothetical protein
MNSRTLRMIVALALLLVVGTLGFSPTSYGIASVLAGCLAFAMLWVILHQGPNGPLNNMIGMAAICLPLLFGCVCGLIGVSAGIYHNNWLGSVIATLGMALNGLVVLMILPHR